MIYRIESSFPTFKNLKFHSGLNILMAQKEKGATEKQTRNRSGKTSMIEIVHFLTGANVEEESLFKEPPLADHSFRMEFDLGGEKTTVERSANKKQKSKVRLSNRKISDKDREISNREWLTVLGRQVFGLDSLKGDKGRTPTFRMLFPYFVRRQFSEAFFSPDKHGKDVQTGDSQVALMYLLGLDWRIAGDWQLVRDREKTLKELRKAAGAGAFGSFVGKSSDLRTQLVNAEDHLRERESQVGSFRVLPQYRELEAEADQITRDLNALANENTIDSAIIRDVEVALQSEAPPPLCDLEAVYAEAGVALPGTAVKRYDEVRSFHESVIKNRQHYLSGEIQAAKQRIDSRERKKTKLDQRRSEVMNILRSHGALDQFSKLQSEADRLKVEVESLRRRFEAAEQLEGTKDSLDMERKHLALRLQRDFTEQSQRLAEAILAFEKTSKRLLESAGSMKIDKTDNGPSFQFTVQGSRSKGINNMQIFCFDMMLMRLCIKRGIGPGFLIHDSHLFDGVDGRQVISALKAGSEFAEELGFQYIVTLNEDDAFKETVEGFNLRDHVLDTVITDAKEDGGLFGIRF